jgi:hypothetical protein
MEKITEKVTFVEGVQATASVVAVSSSTLVNLENANLYLALVTQGVATTAGTVTVSIYQSTASTWAGAVATLITSSVLTGSSTTASRLLKLELDPSQLTEGYNHVGIYVQKADTASGISAVHVLGNERY